MVELDIGEVVVHRALSHVLDSTTAPPGSYRVTDRPERSCDVLVAHVRPLSCRDAVRAFRGGTARAILCADTPDELPALLGRLACSWCAVPRRVLDAAAVVARLTTRQQALVAAIGEGRPLPDEARLLGISAATLKRDLRAVRAELGAPDRSAIAALAHDLGLV